MNKEQCKKLEERIIEIEFEDYDLQKKLSEELYEIAKKDNCTEYMGKALLYKGESLIYRDTKEAEKCAQESVELLKQLDNPKIMAKAYNILGILAGAREDLSLSLDNYLCCFDICKDNDITYTQALCACNIGVIFQVLHSYEQSIEYFNIATECFKKEKDSPYTERNLTNIYTNMLVCYLKQKDIIKVREYLTYLKESKRQEANEIEFTIKVFDTILAKLSNQEENINIDEVIELARNLVDALEYIDIYEIFTDFLFENKDYVNLKKMLDIIESQIDLGTYQRTGIKFIKYRLCCIEEERNFEEYAKYTKDYIYTYEQITDNYYDSILHSLQLRMYVEELKNSKREYEQKAITDMLTQLYNRQGFAKKADKLLDKAIKNQKPISIFLIDIDYFKQINDYYGHIYGDECLKNVAGILKEVADKNTIVSRYGGDEFVIFAYNITKEASVKMAKHIKESIEQLAISSEKSPISNIMTLSQGIYNNIPKENDTMINLLNLADEELYKVKKQGRNGYSN